MNASCGKSTTRKGRTFVTITPYTEQEKRVLNGSSNTITPSTTTTSTNTATLINATSTTSSSSVPPPPPPPLPLPSKVVCSGNNEDSVEMQSIESFKLKETPNSVIPKPPATYFSVNNSSTASNGSPRHMNGAKGLNNSSKEQCSTTTNSRIASAESTLPSNTKSTVVGKVAIRIGAYEGEAKQPAKLDFLSQQSKSEKNGTEEVNGPVVSRLQNELAATLQRSNLRKKTEGEIQLPVKSINENTTSTIAEKEGTNSEANGKLTQGNVEKLATALSNKVTIRVSPEDGGR